MVIQLPVPTTSSGGGGELEGDASQFLHCATVTTISPPMVSYLRLVSVRVNGVGTPSTRGSVNVDFFRSRAPVSSLWWQPIERNEAVNSSCREWVQVQFTQADSTMPLHE